MLIRHGAADLRLTRRQTKDEEKNKKEVLVCAITRQKCMTDHGW